jgi:hypothetical protein
VLLQTLTCVSILLRIMKLTARVHHCGGCAHSNPHGER